MARFWLVFGYLVYAVVIGTSSASAVWRAYLGDWESMVIGLLMTPREIAEGWISLFDGATTFGWKAVGDGNRQPARKVVPNDKEWCTMTVVAQANHLAVWVNGYQTADYSDTRPASKDARKGSKTDKRPISVQGHDSTTDLSFRNIRIVELPPVVP